MGALSILLLVVLNSTAQNIYVNTKLVDQKKCLPLDSIQNISLNGRYETLISIEMSLASGTIVLGGVRFSTLQQLSDFDTKKWLASEEKSNGSSLSTAIKPSGKSDSKMKANAGDRIVVIVVLKEGSPIVFTLLTCR